MKATEIHKVNKSDRPTNTAESIKRVISVLESTVNELKKRTKPLNN